MPKINAKGIELYYELTGPADAPVIAFSNSLGTTLEMWDEQVKVLSGHYQCLRYDTRGHGRSELRDHPAVIDELADDLAHLLDALKIDQVHMVGLSLGGMTGQAFAVRYPARVMSLTLMATSAYLALGGWAERAATVLAKGMGAIVDPVMERWFTSAFAQNSPAEFHAIRERFLQIDPKGYAVCCGVIHAMDLRPMIGTIQVPTLILAGAEDPATPVAMMEDIRTRIMNAELIILPRAAHILALERADLVNRHLQAFLQAFSGTVPQPGRQVEEDADFEAGLANRKAVLGAAHVERSLAKAGKFAGPWQDFITRMAWGEIWGDATLPWKTRSLVTLAMMVALHREEEFKLHIRPALKNGVTIDELRALLLQTAIYGGVPAANGAFRWVKEVLGDEID